MPSNKQLIIFLIISGLVFTGFGYFVLPRIISQPSVGGSITSCQAINDIFTTEQNNGQKIMENLNLKPRPVGRRIRYILGSVEDNKDNKITIKAQPIESPANQSLDQRIVEINKDTKIYAVSEADLAAHKKALAEYDQKIKEQVATSTSALVRPQLPKTSVVNLEDIKVGDKIGVLAVDEDIKNIKQFLAAEIRILPASTNVTEFVIPPAVAQPVK